MLFPLIVPLYCSIVTGSNVYGRLSKGVTNHSCIIICGLNSLADIKLVITYRHHHENFKQKLFNTGKVSLCA